MKLSVVGLHVPPQVVESVEPVPRQLAGDLVIGPVGQVAAPAARCGESHRWAVRQVTEAGAAEVLSKLLVVVELTCEELVGRQATLLAARVVEAVHPQGAPQQVSEEVADCEYHQDETPVVLPE